MDRGTDLAPVQRVMAQHAQRPAVGRDVQAASRDWYDVMAKKLFFAATALTAPAISTQDIGPEPSPLSR